MRRLLAALVALPMVAGSVGFEHHASVESTSQEPLATLSGGDVGTIDLGLSATSAAVSVGILPTLLADDILDITSTDDAWNVRAELVSFTGFGPLQSITLALRDGTGSQTQIAISSGTAGQSTGTPVDLPTTQDTELTAIGSGSGTVTFDLVLEPDAGGPALRYHCTLTA